MLQSELCKPYFNSNGKIADIVNNYDFMSFNIGPTLMGWIRTNTPDTYKRIQEADKSSQERMNGHGNAIAQVYNHIIMPLASEQDKRTQIRWGIEDFKFHFGRMPEAMWLAETAINFETVVELIKAGIKFTILSPTQADKFRKFGDKKWTDCSNTNIDTTRPYRIYPRDKEGNLVCNGYLDVFSTTRGFLALSDSNICSAMPGRLATASRALGMQTAANRSS